MSIGLAQAKAVQQASISVTKKAMDVAEQQMQGVVDMMQSVPPSFGQQLDIRV